MAWTRFVRVRYTVDMVVAIDGECPLSDKEVRDDFREGRLRPVIQAGTEVLDMFTMKAIGEVKAATYADGGGSGN